MIEDFVKELIWNLFPLQERSSINILTYAWDGNKFKVKFEDVENGMIEVCEIKAEHLGLAANRYDFQIAEIK